VEQSKALEQAEKANNSKGQKQQIERALER
jgi:hypothetical protein